MPTSGVSRFHRQASGSLARVTSQRGLNLNTFNVCRSKLHNGNTFRKSNVDSKVAPAANNTFGIKASRNWRSDAVFQRSARCCEWEDGQMAAREHIGQLKKFRIVITMLLAMELISYHASHCDCSNREIRR